jgi:putative inorganic carbon (HCO3(-)) transporter
MGPLTSGQLAWVSGLGMVLLSLVGWWTGLPWVMLLPVVALIAGLAVFRLDLLLALLLFLVPLSINLAEFGWTSMGWYMPTEPMLFGLMVLWIIRAIGGQSGQSRFFLHPISLIVIGSFVWMGITILPSSHPLVSLKAWVSRGWFLAVFFFMLAEWFERDPKAKDKLLALLVIPMLMVCTYTIFRHVELGLTKAAAHWVMKPFFRDHTSYGAVLAMLLPPALAMAWRQNQLLFIRMMWIAGTAFLMVATVLSFTRAAWVSLVVAVVVWGAIKVGLKLRTLLLAGASMIILLVLSWDALVVRLEQNDQASSDNITQHIQSISNVTNDDSNLERLNRWSCAVAMFGERPVFGWGAGTYQFEYARFQTSDLRTVISTNNADLGNAHSEYLGPLAEQGLFGLVGILALLFATLHLGFKLQRTLIDPDDKRMAMALFLGLLTYFVHGILNNFLDTDKASAPFWGFLAILVLFDLKNNRNEVKA